MNIAHKQMEACGYTNETFDLDASYKQEVSFSPIVFSFFPDRSEREKIVEFMMIILENYQERPHDCFQPNAQSIFQFQFENEGYVFEYAFDDVNQKQLFILEIDGSRCFGYGVNDTIH
tara:strand:+ start:485 stop:838 length:354 start_codon:yes stop_codon:yes gene_type:complete